MSACLVTLVAFFVNIFAYDMAWSTTSDNVSNTKTLNVNTFAIPEYLGHVKSSWQSSSPYTVIHIQDAHCNYDAQKKIAEVVAFLNKEYGAATVNLEGGALDYDLSPLTSIQEPIIRNKVADHFVKEGLVNGAEFFAINNPNKISLWGIEDPSLYMKNLLVYRSSLRYKDGIDKSLKYISHLLANLKIKIYSKELLSFDAKYSQYKANNIEFRDYIGYLLDTAAIKAINIIPYHNIDLLRRALQEEAGIDFKKADAERDELIDVLQKRLSKDDMEKLVAKTIEFKAAKISQKDFHDLVLEFTNRLKIDLADMEELRKYIDYIALYDSIDKTKVPDEIDSLEASIKNAMIENDSQGTLAALSKNLALMKNIFNVTLSSDDYRYYKAHENDFAIRNFTSFIEKEASIAFDSSLQSREAAEAISASDLDRYREGVSEFYEYSFKRDESFLKNIKITGKIAILITGGFHTDNLCEMFHKAGVSYISIIPNFKNPKGYQCPYFNILSGERSLKISDAIPSVIKNLLAIPDPLSPAMMSEYASEGRTVKPDIKRVIEAPVTPSETYIGLSEAKNAVGKVGTPMTELSSVNLPPAAVNIESAGIPITSVMSASDIDQLRTEIMKVVQLKIGNAGSSWIPSYNGIGNAKGFVINMPDNMAGADAGRLMEEILEALRPLAQSTGKWKATGTLVRELDGKPVSMDTERHKVYVQTKGTDEVVLEEKDDCIVIGIFTRSDIPIFSLTILMRASAKRERKENAVVAVPPTAKGAVHTEEVRKSEVVTALNKASDRTRVVKVVVGIPDGEAHNGYIKVVNELGGTLARGRFSILESDKTKGYQEGDVKQIVPFVIVPGDDVQTKLNYEAAMNKALATVEECDGYVVSFAPQIENGPKMAHLYSGRSKTIIIPDAYTDLDSKEGSIPDVMARVALARNIAFYMSGGDKEGAWTIIKTLIRSIADNNLEGVNSVEKLLESLNEDSLRIRRLDINKDFAGWKRMQIEIASSA